MRRQAFAPRFVDWARLYIWFRNFKVPGMCGDLMDLKYMVGYTKCPLPIFPSGGRDMKDHRSMRRRTKIFPNPRETKCKCLKTHRV